MIEDNLFDTPEKIEAAISSFRDLQGHPGWILVKKIVDANIEVLKEHIIRGGESEEVMNRLRDRLQVHQEVINTPVHQIKQLTLDTAPDHSFDPYDKHKPLEKLDKDIE